MNEVIVNHCKTYIYLGTTITDDGNYKFVINNDLNLRLKHVFKFHTFLYKNAVLPFCMKKRVTEACLMSALLDGCESWLCNEYGKMNNVYTSIIKSLLGVRKSTCNDTCLREANFPSLKSYVTQHKKSFFQKKWPFIQEGDPLNRAMELVKQKNTKSY